MSLKAKLEALIYAAEYPISLDQMSMLLKEDLLARKLAPNPEHAEDHLGAVETGTETPSARRAQIKDKAEKAELRSLLRPVLEELISEFNKEEHGIEIRQVAGGYRMSTKPEHHDVVRAFSKSLKPPVRLSLQALETLAVIAYKQPVTVPEIGEIRGVDCSAVIGTLLDRKLITTAGRKAVVGRPMLYKTSKDFLLRFGLKDVADLPSIEEFEKIAAGDMQEELFAARDAALPDATGVPDDGGAEQLAEDKAEAPQNVTEPTVSSDPHHNKTDDQATEQIASESTGG
ncbi:MAG TPA: SMC-Scp complex subunit ScpB [Verrucomicrobiae bacterium]|jgi:segregation and condensation protein B|nr:SMC-Scp complex subunit ScpB [Verrucomicrobiae bacterium]